MRFFSFVVFLFIASASFAEKANFVITELDGTPSIAGQWLFQPGDDQRWAQHDFDDNQWPSIEVPLTWVDQGYPELLEMAWYRVRLKFSLANPETLSQLGIGLGKIHSAYEVYAGGELIGAVGRLPPQASFNYDQHKVYRIPRHTINDQGEVLIALRVWGGGSQQKSWEGGTYDGPFEVGFYSDLLLNGYFAELPYLILAVIFIVFGVNHLFLYQRNPQLRAYFWYGLLALDIGIYTFSISQWSHIAGLPFLLQKKIEFSILYVLPAITIQVIMSLLDIKIGKWLRRYQWSLAMFAPVVIIIPNLEVHFYSLSLWQYWALPAIVGMPIFVLLKAWRGNAEAKLLWLGVMLLGLTGINDILIDSYHVSTPHVIPLGFIAVIVFVMMSVSSKFTAMFNDLESEVSLRTSELLAANSKLNEAAVTDLLTGCFNRRGFGERAVIEIARVNRGVPPFAIVMADIDHFKAVNDNYGHSCGDYVLQQFASLIQQHLRDIDVFARWGGEEFIFLLPQTDATGATALAEKLRQIAQNSCYQYHQQQLNFTLSFGVAIYQADQGLDACLQLADKALYQAKAAGRNSVILSEPAVTTK